MTRTLILLAIGFFEGVLAMAIALEVAYRVAERRRHRRALDRIERHFAERAKEPRSWPDPYTDQGRAENVAPRAAQSSKTQAVVVGEEPDTRAGRPARSKNVTGITKPAMRRPTSGGSR